MPGAPFDESHFLDYLMTKPKYKRAVYNSFSGLRRYNAFIDELQLHFSICFSLRDFEANYPLDKLVQRIAELQASRRSCLASFRDQRRHGFGWGTIFIANLLAVALVVASAQVSQPLAVALIVILVFANVAVALFFARWRAYSKRLMSQIQAKAQRDA